MNKKAKVIAMMLSVIMVGGVFTGCAQNTNTSSQIESQAKKEGKFTLEYTDVMKDQGFTEPIVLDKEPERVVSITAATTPLLFKMGVSLVGVPNSSIYEIPEDYEGELLQTLMSDDFDIETVVSLNPDLVIMPASSQEQYGKTLEESNIPVYYTNGGHSTNVSAYESTYQEAKAIINAFDKDSEAGKEVLKSYEDLKEKMKQSKVDLEGKSVMVLATTQYIQSKAGTVGSMADIIGLTNVFENDQTGMVPLDQETTMEYDPDVVIFVGSSMSIEENKATAEAEFKSNPKYWQNFDAIKNGNIIYLPSSYMPSTGIGIVDQISNLIDLVYETLEVK